MADNVESIFGVAETPEGHLEDWKTVPRSEMFRRTIVAVDGAKAEAEEVGDARFARYVDQALFPFLEHELERATREEDEK